MGKTSKLIENIKERKNYKIKIPYFKSLRKHIEL